MKRLNVEEATLLPSTLNTFYSPLHPVIIHCSIYIYRERWGTREELLARTSTQRSFNVGTMLQLLRKVI